MLYISAVYFLFGNLCISVFQYKCMTTFFFPPIMWKKWMNVSVEKMPSLFSKKRVFVSGQSSQNVSCGILQTIMCFFQRKTILKNNCREGYNLEKRTFWHRHVFVQQNFVETIFFFWKRHFMLYRYSRSKNTNQTFHNDVSKPGHTKKSSIQRSAWNLEAETW